MVFMDAKDAFLPPSTPGRTMNVVGSINRGLQYQPRALDGCGHHPGGGRTFPKAIPTASDSAIRIDDAAGAENCQQDSENRAGGRRQRNAIHFTPGYQMPQRTLRRLGAACA